jgi:hypothetical protein
MVVINERGWMKTGISKDIRKALAKDHACYVLITCTEPSEDGDMNVEMTYEGDPVLAAYLLERAQMFVDEEEDEEVVEG